MDDRSEPKDAHIESSVGQQQDGSDGNSRQDHSERRKESEQCPKTPGKGDGKPKDEVIRLQQVKPAEFNSGNALDEPLADHQQDGNNNTDSHDDPSRSKVSTGPTTPGKGDSKPTDDIRQQQVGKHKPESLQKRQNPSKIKTNSRKPTKPFKLMRRFKTFGVTVKKLWDVWGNFKTKNNEDPSPTLPDKTLGVPGYEEIACIEAEVPDIMMTDKDRVRTSCKECMKDPPAFPSKEQVKAKLIAADKYYGVKAAKSKECSDADLEHDADYYDVDGTVVRPSWRFILERPLVEQYVLMTNYIRKVSVMSELKEGKQTKFIEEEDSGSDTEYKKFEQKLIRERRELLKPILKPKTQEMAVQTSFIPEGMHKEELKESLSEISLYPESEESTNSPEASAVTIVTSMDCSSPLQSDFDSRANDNSASYQEGNWWESQAHCQPSETFPTSCDSVNNNVSSSSDGQLVPVHAAWGGMSLRPTQNEGEWIVPSSHKSSVESTTKPKDSKRVHFSPVVTYYHSPDKKTAVYNLPEDHGLNNQVEPEPNSRGEHPSEGTIVEEPAVIEENQDMNKPRPPNKTLTNILQDRRSDQIVSVTLPEGWHEDRVFHNKQKINVAVSRTSAGNRQITKKASFQDYDEIPDVQYSNPQIATVQEKTDSNIQTQMGTPKSAASRMQAKTPRHTHPTTAQLVQINSINTIHKREPDDGTSSLNVERRKRNFHDLRTNDHLVMESVGIGTNIQAAANQVAPRRKPGAPSKVQPSVGPTKPSMISNRIISNPPQKETIPPWWFYKYETSTNIPNNPIQQSTHSAVDLKNEPPRTLQPKSLSVRSDPSLSQRPLHQSYTCKPHRKQQGSTDTEGSSNSNDHIKLKASPGCIFKVATPTDLSKISVEDFYPDVPEIDAELSQNSESTMVSAPKVELVFDKKETALKCKQGAYERHKMTNKEENTIFQSPASKGRTIMVSSGIEIDISQQKEPRSARNAPALNGIQPRPVPKISSRKAEPTIRESTIVPEQATRIDGALRREAMLEIGVKQILKVKEGRKLEIPPLNNTNSTSAPQRSTLKQQQMKKHTEGPKAEKLGECSKQDKAGNDTKCERKLDHHEEEEVATIEDEQKIGKGEELNGMECAKPESDSKNLEQIQRQFNINNHENLLPIGRSKNFMRTLSSLTEETSSVMETTSSSTAEMARSVEELKTIFEKKTEASSSIASELGENQSHSKKSSGLTDGKCHGGGGFGVLEATGVEQERPGQVRTQSNEKHPPNTGEHSGTGTGRNTPTQKLDISKTTAKQAVETRLGPVTENKNPLLHEESSTPQLSQIDVIKPSEIYSNTSMYFSTSEDRVAKLSKARTTFEPMKDDDRSGSYRKDKGFENLHIVGPMESERSSSSPITADVQVNEGREENQELDDKKSSSNRDHGRDCTVGCNDQNITDRETGETSEPPGNAAEPSGNTAEPSGNTAEPTTDNKQRSHEAADASEPSEAKQWLMDVIPKFSKPTRFQGFRPLKPVCMKEAVDAVRNRQEAVKPVFRFLKRQREMEDNK